MKRIMILLCVLCLLLSCGCGKTTPSVESTTEQITEQTEIVKPDISAEFLSLALTMTLRDAPDPEVLKTPVNVWTAIGWYCAFQKEVTGRDHLMQSETDALQQVIFEGGYTVPIPPQLSESVLVKQNGSRSAYYFMDSVEDLFGQTLSYDYSLSDKTATIVLHDNEKQSDETYSYTYVFSADGVHPESLTKITPAKEKTTAPETKADFTIEDLIEANRLSKLLDVYKSVRSSYSYMGTTMTSNYFKQDGQIVSTQKRADESESEMYWSYGKIFAAKADDHFVTYCSPAYYTDKEDTELMNEYDLCMFYGDDLRDVKEKGDTYTFSIYNMDEIPMDYVVDKGTLALRSVTEHHSNDEISVTKFTYDAKPETYGLLDGWSRPLRTVTMTYNDGGKDMVYKVKVPDDLEFVPTFDGEVAMYMNEAYTEPYAYPGNGADYAFFITTAMG